VIGLLLGLVSEGGKKYSLLVGLTSVICLGVPALMAKQNWDDHDRSHKTTAPDLARNYLESCAPNAIIFTFGDNDTYPLWYAQEVEGVRTDVRLSTTAYSVLTGTSINYDTRSMMQTR
jgi:hypothetical protein